MRKFTYDAADPSWSLLKESKGSFSELILDAFDYPYKPLALTLAIQQIDANVPNKKILLQKPLQSIKMIAVIESDSHKSGLYDTKSRTIFLRENVVMRFLLLHVVIHEFGHHLDDMWLAGTPARKKALMEYQAEKDRVEKLMGEKIDKDKFDTQYVKLVKAGTEAISLYSLRTPEEWIAEAFATYFSGYSPIVHQKEPATYQMINDLCQGTV